MIDRTKRSVSCQVFFRTILTKNPFDHHRFAGDRQLESRFIQNRKHHLPHRFVLFHWAYPVETLAPIKDGEKAETAESIDSKTRAIFMVIFIVLSIV